MSSNGNGNSANSYQTLSEWFAKNDPVFVSIDGFIINIEEESQQHHLQDDDDDEGEDSSSLLSLKKSQDSLNSLSEGTTWRRCRTCRCTFETKEEQRGHFTTPWHLYNVKITSKGEQQPLTQEEYDTKMLSEIDSIHNSTKPDSSDEFSGGSSSSSGEDNSEGEDGDDDDDDKEEEEDIEEEIPGRTPLVIFADKKGEQVVVWRCVLEAIAGVKKLVTIGNEAGVRAACQTFVRNVRSGDKKHTRWAVFLCCSGYFAGAVFEGRTLVAHKTFRRYTCRKKQGKSQSNYDAKGKHPHSGGAAKRRYHEKRYVEEVNDVVSSWRQLLTSAACSLVLVSAPKVQRSGKLLLFDGSPLNEASDIRVRKVPFPTRRPTLAVAESIHRTTFAAVPPAAIGQQQQEEIIEEEGGGGGVGISDVTAESLVAASRLADPAEFMVLLDKFGKSGKPKKERVAVLSRVLLPVCAAGNFVCAEALVGNGANVASPVSVDAETGMTPLHYAARSGNLDLVQMLLKVGAGKSVKDASGKTAAEYAVNDKVKELLSVSKPKKGGNKKGKTKRKKKQTATISVYDIEDSSDEESDPTPEVASKPKKKPTPQQKQKAPETAVAPQQSQKVFVDPITCVICGKQEERKKSFMNSGKRFCSMDCVRKFLNN